MHTLQSKLVISLVALGLAGAAGAAEYGNDPAQQQQYQDPTAGQAQPQAEPVSEGELEQFSQAHQQVEQIRETYMDQAQDAGDPDAMAEVQMSMQQEMVEAVQETGLDVGSYNRIAQMLPYDEELRERLEGLR